MSANFPQELYAVHTESASDLQFECARVEPDRTIKVIDVDVYQKIHTNLPKASDVQRGAVVCAAPLR